MSFISGGASAGSARVSIRLNEPLRRLPQSTSTLSGVVSAIDVPPGGVTRYQRSDSYFSSSIGLRSTPTPSISISQLSPCFIQTGLGLRA